MVRSWLDAPETIRKWKEEIWFYGRDLKQGNSILRYRKGGSYVSGCASRIVISGADRCCARPVASQICLPQPC